MKKLTEQQQKLVTENCNFIYWVIRKLNLPIDDYYGIAAIGLCKAARTFDITQRANFSTYAYICMENELKMALRKERRYMKYGLSFVSIEQQTCENLTIGDLLISYENCESTVKANLFIEHLNKLSHLEKSVLKMSLQGYKQKEIARFLNISQPYTSRIRTKAIQIMKGELA